MKTSKATRIIFAASGTGGHLHPAQAVALEIEDFDLLFAGHALSSNPFFDQTRFCFVDIPAPSFSFKKMILVALSHIKGFFKIYRLLDPERDIVIGFGSIYTFPVLLAALIKKCPFILFNCDSILGKLQRLFAPFAELNLSALFPINHSKNAVYKTVMMPLLAEKTEKIEKKSARESFGLDPAIFTFFVFGGSQGAISMNEVVIKALACLKEKGFSFQVIHLIGSKMNVEKIKQMYAFHGIKNFVNSFIHDMGKAYSASDALIARCGASTVAETVCHQIPALYIPYPFLKDAHQEHNANYIKEVIKGGDWIRQNGLGETELCKKIELFLERKDFFKHNLEMFCLNQKEPSVAKVIIEWIHHRY